MKSIEVSLVMITTVDGYVMQKRPDKPEIGQSGKIGFFGGRREEGEKPNETASRELNEEIGLDRPAHTYSNFGIVTVESELGHGEKVRIKANIYTTSLGRSALKGLVCTDGEIVLMNDEEIDEHFDMLTPATQATFKNLF